MTNDEIALAWRKEPFVLRSWRRCEDQRGFAVGEAGGCKAEALGFDRYVYIKPVSPKDEAHLSIADRIRFEPHTPRAAREKIASDLAHDLGFPVPPAQLSMFDVNGVCIPVVASLVMHDKRHSWGEVRQELASRPDICFSRLCADASDMVAFDAWVRRSDNGAYDGNISCGYDPLVGNYKLLFIDYSYSLGHDPSWENGGWIYFNPVPPPPELLRHLDRKRLRNGIEKIRGLSQKTIEEIVGRIPVSHLNPGKQQLLVEGLVERQPLLANALKGYL